jgi:hypothetical protein
LFNYSSPLQAVVIGIYKGKGHDSNYGMEIEVYKQVVAQRGMRHKNTENGINPE